MKLPTEKIRELRRRETEAERVAWHLLRGRRVMGLKFRRQFPIEDFVVDFYCFEVRLAIELDGSIHSQPSQIRRDAAKESFLKRLGLRVLRLPNGFALEDPEGFIEKVRTCALRIQGHAAGKA